MKITIETMREAMRGGYPVLVIINGEYYEIDLSAESAENERKEGGLNE